MIHPSLSNRFKTIYRQLRYQRLPVNMITDTMFSKTFSRQGNKAAQIGGTSDGFARAFPLKLESQPHLFSRDGVPNTMIMDGAKAQVQGEFRRKLRDADCHVKQTEPHTQHSNAAEGIIHELKRGVVRQLMRSGCPKRL